MHQLFLKKYFCLGFLFKYSGKFSLILQSIITYENYPENSCFKCLKIIRYLSMRSYSSILNLSYKIRCIKCLINRISPGFLRLMLYLVPLIISSQNLLLRTFSCSSVCNLVRHNGFLLASFGRIRKSSIRPLGLLCPLVGKEHSIVAIGSISSSKL